MVIPSATMAIISAKQLPTLGGHPMAITSANSTNKQNVVFHHPHTMAITSATLQLKANSN